MFGRLAAIGVAVALSAGAAAGLGAVRWKRATARLHSRLEAARAPVPSSTYDSRDIESLPPPVQRYLRSVLAEGQRVPSGVRFTHEGTFNMGDKEPDWKRFRSSQFVSTMRPGFVWDARVRVAPLMDAFVHDAYVVGEGILNARLLGLVTVADVRGTPEAAKGELVRYLAETMWYPTALLPGHGVSWEPIDDRSARATLSDGGVSVSLEFRFGEDGLLESTFTSSRPRIVGDQVIEQAWGGRCWAYEMRDGIRIPVEAEAAWFEPSGPKPYWRGRMTGMEFVY